MCRKRQMPLPATVIAANCISIQFQLHPPLGNYWHFPKPQELSATSPLRCAIVNWRIVEFARRRLRTQSRNIKLEFTELTDVG